MAEKHAKSAHEVKKAMLQLVLVADALRFSELEEWMLTTLTSKKGAIILRRITRLFRKWGDLSTVFHQGRHAFNNGEYAEIKKKFKTYDRVCVVLGVANRRNLQKEMKKMVKKKKREEAEINSDNERRGRKKH